MYKLARLSLRPDDDPSEPDTLATIGDSPRSDVSGAFPADPDAAAELERPRPVPTGAATPVVEGLARPPAIVCSWNCAAARTILWVTVACLQLSTGATQACK